MAENTTDSPVQVTGEQRLHPALRRLSRACIALVRWQRAQPAAAGTSPASTEIAAPAEQREEAGRD